MKNVAVGEAGSRPGGEAQPPVSPRQGGAAGNFNLGKKKRTCCKWAPLLMPLERRLQTLAVVVMMCIFFGTILTNGLVLIFPILLPVYLLYLAWFLLLDRNAHLRGGRNPWGRKWSLWRLFRDYFPADLVAEVPLDPKQVYLFGLHPHGVIGISAWANFFNTVSPVLRDINYRIVTLASNFFIPISREWLLFLGLIGSDKKGILYALNKGLSVAIVVGGAAEALEIHDSYHGIVLDRRKGACLGCCCVALNYASFGENALFNTVTENTPGTKVRHWQERMKSVRMRLRFCAPRSWRALLGKALGWTLPLVHGRGIWNYSFGMLPFRKPIITVIGKPIPVTKIENPTQEDIDRVHDIYKEALLSLHERWRVRVGETTRLKIIA